MSAEEQIRKIGDLENANPFYDVSDGEDDDMTILTQNLCLDINLTLKNKGKELTQPESQMDGVRIDVANLDETRGTTYI